MSREMDCCRRKSPTSRKDASVAWFFHRKDSLQKEESPGSPRRPPPSVWKNLRAASLQHHRLPIDRIEPCRALIETRRVEILDAGPGQRHQIDDVFGLERIRTSRGQVREYIRRN